MSTQAKSVKYYFDDQIRRFSIDVPTDGQGVFGQLSNKIVSIYPDVPIDEVQLCWKDADNELISVGGDEDIKEAMKDSTNAEILRVFGTLKTKSPGYGSVPLHRHRRPFGPPGGPRHPAFSLRHFPGMNPVVDPVATVPPTSPPVPQPQPTPEDPTAHKGVTCDGCEQPVKNRRYKCSVCPDFDLCEACEGRHLHDQHPMIRISDPKDFSWRRLFGGRGCSFRGQRPPGPPHPFPPPFGPEMFAQFAQAAMQPTTTASQPSPPGGDQNNNAPAQFLKNVGENIAAILSNFGIDVDVDVEHNGKREKLTTTEPSAQPTAPAPTEQVVVSPTPPAPSAPTPMEATTTEPTATATPNAEPNWTFVDRSDVVTYPSVNVNSAPQNSTVAADPKIQSALALMTAMGFTNEGGWLINLIESKGGDINAVLDTLNPARRS